MKTYAEMPHSRRNDFADVAKILLSQAPEVCRHLLPGGQIAGHEYTAAPRRAGGPGDGLSVNTRTGIWKHFADGEGGGDLISLWAYVERCSQGDARDAAARWLGIETSQSARAAVHAHRPQPEGSIPFAPPYDDEDWWKGCPASRIWTYQNADGSMFGQVYRFDHPTKRRENGKPIKTIRPWDGRMWKAPSRPRPLYRLPEVMVHSGPVVVVEGEKAAEAVVEAGYCGTTCWGGTQAASYTDWSPLQRRDVILWRDNDDAGLTWLDKISAACREVGVGSARVVQ